MNDKWAINELEHVLDLQYGFIPTVRAEDKGRQKAYYEGILTAAQLLYKVWREENGKHHIEVYHYDNT